MVRAGVGDDAFVARVLVLWGAALVRLGPADARMVPVHVGAASHGVDVARAMVHGRIKHHAQMAVLWLERRTYTTVIAVGIECHARGNAPRQLERTHAVVAAPAIATASLTPLQRTHALVAGRSAA